MTALLYGWVGVAFCAVLRRACHGRFETPMQPKWAVAVFRVWGVFLFDVHMGVVGYLSPDVYFEMMPPF